MELPFAVDTPVTIPPIQQQQEEAAPDHHHHQQQHHDANDDNILGDSSAGSSLVMASSQGSLTPALVTVDDHPMAENNHHHHLTTSTTHTTNTHPEMVVTTTSLVLPAVPYLDHNVHRDSKNKNHNHQTTMVGGRAMAIPGASAGSSSSTASTTTTSRMSSMLSRLGYGKSMGTTTTTTTTTQMMNPLDITTTTSARTETNTVLSKRSPKLDHDDDHDSDTPETEVIDFAYVNVTDEEEDEVDIWIDENMAKYVQEEPYYYSRQQQQSQKADILAVLLSNQDASSYNDGDDTTTTVIQHTEQAMTAITEAEDAKRLGNLQQALDKHTEAAKLFHEAAVIMKERDGAMANSLLLLSQTQAKTALSLKRIVKLQPSVLSTLRNNRLRATVRGALENKIEADISDSTFLGRASKPPIHDAPAKDVISNETVDTIEIQCDSEAPNPVDEMMELERELRNMDMALDMSNSIASLDARTHNRLKNSVAESFMLIPGGGSYMSSSSSVILGPAAGRAHNMPMITTAADVRARANRLPNVVVPTRPPAGSATVPLPQAVVAPPPQPQGLEASWWGGHSTAPQILTNSVISLASASAPTHHHHQQHPEDTKQLMRLMDSLRTLGEENAALLREVEGAEAARMEAKAAKQQMARFKEEYGKRFVALKEALEKFRKNYPADGAGNGLVNPVTTSEFSISASVTEQLQRQEQLIRKLTADLKKEKEDSKKKDAALRKYESFYREVKARSAQKAAQRQQQQQQQHPAQKPLTGSRPIQISR